MEIQIPLVIFTSFLAWAAGIFGTQCILALQKRGGAVQLPALICWLWCSWWAALPSCSI